MSQSYDSYRQYFVPGWAISRHIIFSHIQFYLGPYATVRPYQYRGREGYLVTAPGQPLTRVRAGFITEKELNRHSCHYHPLAPFDSDVSYGKKFH
jgi:hypothetical protein